MAPVFARSLQALVGMFLSVGPWIVLPWLASGCATPAPGGMRELTYEAIPRKTQDTAEYSYATGCYHAFLRICSKEGSDELRDACRQDGLEHCEKDAKKFRDWIRSGK